jgi:hypothetical protein
MARIRTIKPEFFTSADICSLTPLSRLFYIALWCEADREGRLDWKPKTFKLRYFPGDNCDIAEMAKELLASGLVATYSVDGIEYAVIPTFLEHQVINNRESDSTRPPREYDASGTRESGRERKGKEGKGRETTLPDDFGLSERVIEWAQKNGHTNLEKHLEYFILKAKAKNYRYTDWDAAFMGAVRDNWAEVKSSERKLSL